MKQDPTPPTPPPPQPEIRPSYSGSHTFSLTATAKNFCFALPAGMLFTKRNENWAWSQVMHPPSPPEELRWLKGDDWTSELPSLLNCVVSIWFEKLNSEILSQLNRNNLFRYGLNFWIIWNGNRNSQNKWSIKFARRRKNCSLSKVDFLNFNFNLSI